MAHYIFAFVNKSGQGKILRLLCTEVDPERAVIFIALNVVKKDLVANESRSGPDYFSKAQLRTALEKLPPDAKFEPERIFLSRCVELAKRGMWISFQ